MPPAGAGGNENMKKRRLMMALISLSICVLAGCKAGVGQPDAGAGHTFPCTHAVKVEAAAENYYVESRIKIDNSEADGDTRPLAQEAFQAYGIDFE